MKDKEKEPSSVERLKFEVAQEFGIPKSEKRKTNKKKIKKS